MRALIAIALLTLSACASDDIILEVTSTRRVPADIDALRITISDTTQTDVLRSLTVLLDKDFPVHVLFTAGDDTPDRLRIEVEARKGNLDLGSTVVEAARGGSDTTVTIGLDG